MYTRSVIDSALVPSVGYDGGAEHSHGGRRSSTRGGRPVSRLGEDERVYRGSNGRYYTGWQVERRLHTGAWRPCIREATTDRRLVGVDDELVLLEPTDLDDLPDWIRIRLDRSGPRAVDVRRTVP